MKVLRFVLPALSLFGVAVCLYALAKLAGVVPTGKLARYPAWTATHFGASIAFALLLPLQLWPALRRSRPRAHRILGRVGVGVGAVMALSGVAMAHLVPDRTVSERIFMSVFFLAWALFLGLGFRAALARDIAAHRTWMVRMTATTLTPLVQRLIFPVFAGSLGIDGMATFWQLFVSAAWIAWGINMAVAEAWLRRAAPRARAAAYAPQAQS